MSFWTNVLSRIAAVQTAVDASGSNQTITVTEQEAMVAGDICVSTSGGFIPFSNLQKTALSLQGSETANEISTAGDTDQAADWIFANIAGYAFNSVTADGTFTPMRVESDGTTTIGSDYIFNAGNTLHIDIASVNNGRFVIGYNDSGGSTEPEVIAGELKPNELTATFGTLAQVKAIAILSLAICKLDNDKAAIFVADQTNNGGVVNGVAVTPATLAITLGVEDTFGNGGDFLRYLSACQVNTDLAGVSYRDDGDTSDGNCTIVSFSGNDPTAGADTDFSNNANTVGTAICSTDSTHVTVVYEDDADNDVTKATTASIVGTTPTFGNRVQLSEGTDETIYQRVVALDSTYFMAIWDNSDDSKQGYTIGSISGNTTAAGTIKHLINDIPGSTFGGKSFVISEANYITYFGINAAHTASYGLIWDIMFVDNNYAIYDILGIAEDAAGTIIVDGVDEGNATGENPMLTYFFTGNSVSLKMHNNELLGYKARVRVLDSDSLQAIGG